MSKIPATKPLPTNPYQLQAMVLSRESAYFGLDAAYTALEQQLAQALADPSVVEVVNAKGANLRQGEFAWFREFVRARRARLLPPPSEGGG